MPGKAERRGITHSKYIGLQQKPSPVQKRRNILCERTNPVPFLQSSPSLPPPIPSESCIQCRHSYIHLHRAVGNRWVTSCLSHRPQHSVFRTVELSSTTSTNSKQYMQHTGWLHGASTHAITGVGFPLHLPTPNITQDQGG